MGVIPDLDSSRKVEDHRRKAPAMGLSWVRICAFEVDLEEEGDVLFGCRLPRIVRGNQGNHTG